VFPISIAIRNLVIQWHNFAVIFTRGKKEKEICHYLGTFFSAAHLQKHLKLTQVGQNVYFQQHDFLSRSLSGCLPGILRMISGYKFLEL